ncbi:multidrug DMT transporter [Deinococcus knuensis]|uniref:DNA damage response protein D n=1 Tax=Deinococcus knuensis TaxID=1837380 RepID=A0ABQ2SX70_9DEIO|nr:multidrug DMT transporter [Deinococcus knuensis]GGS43086.1 DNA damage response protein D [Deinococcus knuensis]
MDTLKKAGAMLAHLDLFHHMLDLRGLLQLAAHMEERGDRVTLISPQTITLIGADMHSDATVTTSKGATIEAPTAYRVLHALKGHDAPEYAVTREELGALNARAVADLEDSDALRAFETTLSRVAAQSGTPATTPTSSAATSAAQAAPADAERPSRGRRTPDAEPTPGTRPGTDQPAA